MQKSLIRTEQLMGHLQDGNLQKNHEDKNFRTFV